MNRSRSWPWLVAVAAIAGATGVVVGQEIRDSAEAAKPPPGGGVPFELGQPGSGEPQQGSSALPGDQGIVPLGGVIRSVDTAAGDLTIAGIGAAGLQRVHVTPETVIVREAPGGAADLKVGDTIVARGEPLEIDAQQVSALQLSPAAIERVAASKAGPGPVSAFFGGASGSGFGQIQGTIIALRPLKVTLAGGAECTLRLKSGAHMARIVEASLKDLNPGDMILGAGQVGPDGTLIASQLGAGFEAPGRRSLAGRLRRRFGIEP